MPSRRATLVATTPSHRGSSRRSLRCPRTGCEQPEGSRKECGDVCITRAWVTRLSELPRGNWPSLLVRRPGLALPATAPQVWLRRCSASPEEVAMSRLVQMRDPNHLRPVFDGLSVGRDAWRAVREDRDFIRVLRRTLPPLPTDREPELDPDPF